MTEILHTPPRVSANDASAIDAAAGEITQLHPRQYKLAVANLRGSTKLDKRTLLLYPVSMGSDNHENGSVVAAMRAIASLRDQGSQLLNLVIHVTDRIHAFRHMADNRDLTLTDAQLLADKEGGAWCDRNLTAINAVLGEQPIIFHWGQWQDMHRDEYNDVLKQVEALFDPQNEHHHKKFHDAVMRDINKFTARMESRGKDYTSDPIEAKRVEQLFIKYVLHEAAGYVVMGRELRNDYMAALRTTEGDRGKMFADRIQQMGGLNKEIARLYPGGHLEAIQVLAKGGTNTMPRGAQNIVTTKIEIVHPPSDNRQGYWRFEDQIYQGLYPAKSGRAEERSHHKAFAPSSLISTFRPRVRLASKHQSSNFSLT